MRALLLALLLPASALAGAGASNAELSPAATSAALTLYVDTAGNDANACTSSGAGACRTLQAAVDKLPKRLRHPAVIDIGAGNFTGAIISNIQYEPELSTALVNPGTGLLIRGQMSAVTPATGSGSGTITSSATSAPGGHLVITDTGQSWTVNDLRGTFLMPTSGSASGTYQPIESNDATTVTVATNSTSGFSAGTTYQIYSPSTVIDTKPAYAPSLPTNTNTVPAAYLIYVVDSGSRFSTGAITFTRLAFSTAGNGLHLRGSSVFVRDASFSGLTGTTTAISAVDTAITLQRVVQVTANAAGANTSCVFVSSSGTSRASMSNGYLRGCNTLGATVTVSRIENVQAGVGGNMGAVQILGNPMGGLSGFSYLSIDCGSASAYGISVGETPTSTTFSLAWVPTSASFYNSSSVDISNCGIGLYVAPTSMAVSTSALTGTGNTIGVAVREGGRYVQHASTTLTGSTADVQIDGANYTLANVRAAGGKRITDAATGSVVVEP